LGSAAIETVGSGYRLVLSGDEVDVDRFEQLADQGRRLAVTGEPERAVVAFNHALELWSGRPFDELDAWAPARSEAHRLEELHRTVEEELLDARLAAGEHCEVATEAEALVTLEPLRERRWAALALAQYRCGRQAAALASLSCVRQLLVEQLGIDPGPELVSLEAAILRHDSALTAPEPRAVSDECP
jgi:DNA-binding SARP family transcriptional activator